MYSLFWIENLTNGHRTHSCNFLRKFKYKICWLAIECNVTNDSVLVKFGSQKYEHWLLDLIGNFISNKSYSNYVKWKLQYWPENLKITLHALRCGVSKKAAMRTLSRGKSLELHFFGCGDFDRILAVSN